MPISLVSLIDVDRQWFKSRFGLETRSRRRVHPLFAATPSKPSTPSWCRTRCSTRASPAIRWSSGAPHIRFYAGSPIYSNDGHPLGTLCIIDTTPRDLDTAQRTLLDSLARMVEAEINKHSINAARERAERSLRELNEALEERIRERTFDLQEKNEALNREIRQRSEVEATLRRSEARVRTMIDNSFSAFIATDADGFIIEWNPSAERIFGWSGKDVIGRPLSVTIIPERHRAAFQSLMARFGADGLGDMADRNVQLPTISRSGDEITVEFAINTFSLDGKCYFGAFLHDVSERLEAKQALEQEEELLDAVLETADVGVIACDADGNLTFFICAANTAIPPSRRCQKRIGPRRPVAQGPRQEQEGRTDNQHGCSTGEIQRVFPCEITRDCHAWRSYGCERCLRLHSGLQSGQADQLRDEIERNLPLPADPLDLFQRILG